MSALKDWEVQLRVFVRDDPRINRLIEDKDGKESESIDYQRAIVDSINEWNSTPPFVGQATLENHPAPSLLIIGAAVRLLWSAGIYYQRNELDYTAGNTRVRVSDKAGPFFQFAKSFQDYYEDAKRRYKRATNMALAYGRAPSEYFLIPGNSY